MRPKPVWLVALGDVLLIAIGLILFALPHHVIPQDVKSEGVVIARPTEAVQATPVPVTEEEEPEIPADEDGTAAVSGMGQLEPEQTGGSVGTGAGAEFTSGDVKTSDENGEHTYVSANVNITAREDTTNFGHGVIHYYVMDIYLKDISSLQSGFAKGKYRRAQSESTLTMAQSLGAVCAINGDFYGVRTEGIVLRNGELYRKTPFEDICVVYWDGTMKTYEKGSFDLDQILADSPYQIWSFGPALLDSNGLTKTEFNTGVSKANPRTAIGYIEKNHFLFVTVKGRSSETEGATMSDLSMLMKTLGCVSAYNLDGGNTSVMVWRGKVFNDPSGGGRECSDIICVVDE